MLTVNFNAYDSYVTDSLYQWDLNQVLRVTGLNLVVVPEVHFSNANMDRAIVRQASMENHVVSVEIPNSLLQDPLTINAYIGIYEGDTFKVVEKIAIPVIRRKRPSDYQIEDADEEIYSFKALENALAQKADSARVDNIIAHNNDTAGNTELVDIRVDIDGITHNSAGTAIRRQIVDCVRKTAGKNKFNKNSDTLIRGKYVLYSDGGEGENANYCYDTLKTAGNVTYTVSPNDNVHIAFFDKDGNYISGVLATSNKTFTTPINAVTMIVSIKITYLDSFQVELGNTVTDYSPYESGTDGETLLSRSVPFDKLSEKVQKTIGKIVNVGSGYEYTSLLKALKDHKDEAITCYIHTGVYDLESEYTAEYGVGYFSTYAGYNTDDVFDRGLNLCDGTVLIGVGNVEIRFNYTGENDQVKRYFAPINTTQNNIVRNITLSIGEACCRYGIHDDFASAGGINVFENCYFTGVSTLNTFIGGGFGENNTYIIENCVFENAGGLNIAYHNNEKTGAKNRLAIKNCYCNGSIRGGMYGNSTEISLMTVTNCRALSISCVLTDDTGTYTNENIKLLSWNNEIMT